MIKQDNPAGILATPRTKLARLFRWLTDGGPGDITSIPLRLVNYLYGIWYRARHKSSKKARLIEIEKELRANPLARGMPHIIAIITTTNEGTLRTRLPVPEPLLNSLGLKNGAVLYDDAAKAVVTATIFWIENEINYL